MDDGVGIGLVGGFVLFLASLILWPFLAMIQRVVLSVLFWGFGIALLLVALTAVGGLALFVFSEIKRFRSRPYEIREETPAEHPHGAPLQQQRYVSTGPYGQHYERVRLYDTQNRATPEEVHRYEDAADRRLMREHGYVIDPQTAPIPVQRPATAAPRPALSAPPLPPQSPWGPKYNQNPTPREWLR